MTKATVLAATAAALLATSSAALASNVSFSADKRVAFAAPHAAAGSTPYFIRKATSATIYSNLATAYPKGLYYTNTGSTVYASSTDSQYVAVGFTPKVNATAVEVEAAVGNFGDGKDKFVLSIYSDSSGIPGTALTSQTVTATTAFGTCCGLIVAKLKTGLALKGGTPYWVAVTLNKVQTTAMDDGAWMLATTNEIDTHPFAFNANNTGWTSSPTTTPPAFGVFSK